MRIEVTQVNARACLWSCLKYGCNVVAFHSSCVSENACMIIWCDLINAEYLCAICCVMKFCHVCLLFCGMSKVLFTWLILHQFIMCFCKPKDGAKLSQHDGWEIECVDSLMSFNHLANVTHQLWQLILAVERCFKSQVFDLSQIFHQFLTPLLCGRFPSFDYVPLQVKRLKWWGEGGGGGGGLLNQSYFHSDADY